MANIFERAGEWLAKRMATYINDERGRRNNILASYLEGDHRLPLRIRMDKNGVETNDNTITNHIGLNVYRSVSRMLRGGVEFVLPENATQQQEYLDTVWDLNKKEILLQQLGLHGAVFGTVYIKIIQDKLDNPLTGKEDFYPRLDALYPNIVRIKTDPQDMTRVLLYRIEWTNKEGDKETSYREDTENLDGSWLITNWEKGGAQQWQKVGEEKWPYGFAPILHWKNLPSLNSPEGMDEISDAVNIQDRYNFTVSNTGKIIKHHASPRTIFEGVSASQLQMVDDSPDSAIAIPNGTAHNLEIQSDLESSRAFSNDLQKSIAAVMREIDLPSVGDKLGQLTNFALRVLYTDAVDKNDTKRQLYGDALKEINRRLLILANYTGEASDPGDVRWGDALPVNVMEEMTADKMALEMHIIDPQTVGEKWAKRWGADWEDVAARLDELQKKQIELMKGVNNGEEDGDERTEDGTGKASRDEGTADITN